MVNIAHRMRKLQTLLNIRLGPGAGKLPPTVQKIHLELAQNILPKHIGPKQFWRTILPRLKYHNPSIPISVTRFQDRTQPPKLTVHTSASPDPITLELNEREGPETILEKMLGQLGKEEFVPAEATQEEVDALEVLREQREQAERDSEIEKRRRMQLKKQKEMLEMASQGAL